MRGTKFFLLVVALVVALPVVAEMPPGMTSRVRDILDAATVARNAGDRAGERAVLEQGLAAVGDRSGEAYFLYGQLLINYADIGNLAHAGALVENMYATARNPGQELAPVVRGLAIQANLHDKAKIALYQSRLDGLLPRLRASRGWDRLGDLWQANIAWARAGALRASGHPQEAEHAYRACLMTAERFLSGAPDHVGGWFNMTECTAGLMQVQIATGQLAAAGAVADQLRQASERVAKMSGRPAVIDRVRGVLGQLAMEQGRLDEARQIFLDTLARLREDEESVRSLRVTGLIYQLAQLAMLRGQWEEALDWHRQRESALRAMGKDRGGQGVGSPEYAFTLIRLDRAGEALTMMERIVKTRGELHDEQSLALWEGRAYHGIALAAAGRKDEALQQMRTALPRMLDIMKGERSSSEAGLLRTARMNWLLDAYLDLLADQVGDGSGEGAAAMDEAFRMADLARGSTVQRALAASASRVRIGDPALAGLARQEQDLQREISALAEAIDNLLARGRIAEQDRIVADMRAELVKLREQHSRSQAEIEQRFPNYAALLNPRPVGIAAIQALLRPEEALVSIYAGSDRTFVWAIPASGRPRFAIVPLAAAELDLKVDSLRQSLDPQAELSGLLPRYRFDIAHELYAKLLAPVAAGWQGASALIVVPHGRLGLLPFGVLLTEPYSAAPARLPYADMAAAPWLIRKTAVSLLPAAVAMPALRAPGMDQHAGRAFIGFGDPLFSTAAIPATSLRGLLRRRNLPSRAVLAGDIDLNPRIDFRRLPPLPDTALEIEEVARVLAADPAREVFLRERASEAQVKKADLSPYRVVMFATHGLMGGELPGVYQPALALANPELSGDGEDGMLTMEEVLGLRLQADWVVLSACNTASAGGRSSESVSGLGRAFFHAGAKSLLVTSWAVETESARLLTTEIFRRQAADPALPRARALQQAALWLMQQSAGKDYSYAHPMFWAPYTLVGDGG